MTIEGNTDRIEVELRWAGGFVSRHALSRPVQTYEQLSNYRELVAHIEALRHADDIVGSRGDVECRRLPPTEAIAPLHSKGY